MAHRLCDKGVPLYSIYMTCLLQYVVSCTVKTTWRAFCSSLLSVFFQTMSDVRCLLNNNFFKKIIFLKKTVFIFSHNIHLIVWHVLLTNSLQPYSSFCFFHRYCHSHCKKLFHNNCTPGPQTISSTFLHLWWKTKKTKHNNDICRFWIM